MPAAETMKCTGKYKDLVKNGLGGTLDKPCANALNIQIYCNQPDVDAWNAVAWDLFKRVRHEWNVTNKAVTIPVEVADYITALDNDYCETDSDGQCVKYRLPESSWYDVNWNATAATTIARWCSRATCALEILENVRGWQAPVEPTQESYDLPEEAAQGAGGVAKDIGEGIGALGKGAGGALGGLGSALVWLPAALVAGLGIVVIGRFFYLRSDATAAPQRQGSAPA
jgi:hypothetical protein